MKKVVYTCLFTNNSRQPDTPFVKDKLEEFDYIIFTNIPDKVVNSGWTPIEMQILNNHPIYTSRYYKWCGHNYLQDYDVAIYVDAYMSPSPNVNWNSYIDRLSVDSIGNSLFLLKHPQRDCIYDECYAIVRCRKDTMDNMQKVITFLEQNKMPKNFGLTEGALFVRHLKNPELNKFFEEFFTLMLKYSYRDQSLLAYMFWKYNVNMRCELPHEYICKSGTIGNHTYT